MSAEPAWQTMVAAPSDQPGGESDTQIQAHEIPPVIRFRPWQYARSLQSRTSSCRPSDPQRTPLRSADRAVRDRRQRTRFKKLQCIVQSARAAQSSSGFANWLILVGIAIPIVVAILIADSENRLREIVSGRSERAEEFRAEIAQLTGRRDALASERLEFSYPLVHQLNLWSDTQKVRISIAAGKEVPAHDRNVGAVGRECRKPGRLPLLRFGVVS